MSYEKVKIINRKSKDNKIIITSSCSNDNAGYQKWEFMKQEKDFHKKELELLRAINGGGLSLNNSCYKWLYAYFKTQEHFRKNDVNYDLYRVTEYKHPIYFIGEPISKGIIYVKIEEKELNNNYMLIYESKINDYKEYYKKEEKEKEEKRITEELEKYYCIFIKYLEEKIKGKYYLYSETYGFIKPKGKYGGFYYSSIESFLNKNDFMEYKKAYCKAKNIGRDIKIIEKVENEKRT